MKDLTPSAGQTEELRQKHPTNKSKINAQFMSKIKDMLIMCLLVAPPC